jgi:putative ABC transport system permease protein
MLATPLAVFVRRDWMAEMSASSADGALLGNIVWILIVLVAAVMLSTLHLITIRERYDELAVRRCEGARRADLAWQVTCEGTVLSLAGGLLGLPLGQAAAAVLREMVGFPFRFEARYALVATLIAVGLGLLASVVPARRAARLDPARVLSRRLA